MSLTLGLTGMDPATETALKSAFVEANARLGDRWSLVPDAEAGHVIVDMDSMYGPMSWLRLHAAGRQVIGLTSAPRTQTDFRLGRPFDVAQLVELLVAVARKEGTDLQQEPATVEAPAARIPAVDATPTAPEAATLDPAAAAPQAPEAEAEADAVPAPAAAPAPTPMPLRDATPAPAEAAPASPPSVAAATPSAPADTLAAWLRPGALSGRFRCRRDAAPTLFIDTAADVWFGPTPLKPIAAGYQGTVERSDFEPLDADAWARETASAGEPQPLSRLRWLGGLVAGGGALLPGVDAQDRFQLFKWPQTEREYPRHFRIATQMMKGPATVAEIALASGVPEADVADFVNANLATGFAEPVAEAVPQPVEAPRARGGLLGRLRNR